MEESTQEDRNPTVEEVFRFYRTGFVMGELLPCGDGGENKDDLVFVEPIAMPKDNNGTGLILPAVVDQGQMEALMYRVAHGVKGGDSLQLGDFVILRNQMLELTHRSSGVLFILRRHIVARVGRALERDG